MLAWTGIACLLKVAMSLDCHLPDGLEAVHNCSGWRTTTLLLVTAYKPRVFPSHGKTVKQPRQKEVHTNSWQVPILVHAYMLCLHPSVTHQNSFTTQTPTIPPPFKHPHLYQTTPSFPALDAPILAKLAHRKEMGDRTLLVPTEPTKPAHSTPT